MGPGVGAESTGTLLDDLENGVDIDGEAEATANIGVLEDLVSEVELEVDRLLAATDHHLDVVAEIELLDPCQWGAAGHHVDVAGFESGECRLVIGDHRQFERVDQGRAAEVRGVGFESVRGAGLVVDEAVGAGADRQRGEVGSGIADRRPDVLGQDRHVAAGELGEGRDRVGEPQLDREVVDHRGGLERRVLVHVMAIAPRTADVAEVLEGEGDVVGRERFAVVPLDAGAERDRPGSEVGRWFGSGGEPLVGSNLALVPEQRVVDQHDQVVSDRHVVGRQEGVEGALVGPDGDADQRYSVLVLGVRWGDQRREQEDEGDADDTGNDARDHPRPSTVPRWHSGSHVHGRVGRQPEPLDGSGGAGLSAGRVGGVASGSTAGVSAGGSAGDSPAGGA